MLAFGLSDMNAENARNPSRTAPLVIRSPLEVDLIDRNGQLVFAAGTVLTPEQIRFVEQRGIQVIVDTPSSDTSPIQNVEPETALLRPYDSASVARLTKCFQQAQVIVEDAVNRLTNQQAPDLGIIGKLFATYVEEIRLDMGVVLASSLHASYADLTADKKLAKRSVQLAILSSSLAFALNGSEEDCLKISMAGLLHDLALYDSLSSIFRKRVFRRERNSELFRQHPLHSAELVSGIPLMTRDIQVLITQVHEQADGSGFPLGLPWQKQHALSPLLNICDAFLTLKDPTDGGRRIVAADAMAYLVHQTGQGCFHRGAMDAFLRCCSIYPVGTKVLLDDSSIASVIRSSQSDPISPIVRIDSSHHIVDLRHSERRIVAPHLTESERCERLPARLYDQILWVGHDEIG